MRPIHCELRSRTQRTFELSSQVESRTFSFNYQSNDRPTQLIKDRESPRTQCSFRSTWNSTLQARHWPLLYSLTKHMRDFASLTFSRCHLLFVCRRTTRRQVGGKLVGFVPSLKDVDFIRCNLKSASIFSYY